MGCRTLQDNSGRAIGIACGRDNKKRCSYCERPSARLCDFEIAAGKTCDMTLCVHHTWSPAVEKDYCRLHRRQIEGAHRAEKAKAEKVKDPALIFIARSKYNGYCRDRDCGARWEAGEPMWWSPQTRESYCDACGELLSETEQVKR